MPHPLTRRAFLRETSTLAAAAMLRAPHLDPPAEPLQQVDHSQVTVTAPLERAQLENARDVLLTLSDDSLLMPFRAMAGLPVPGVDIGGWYQYLPAYDYKHGDAGLAPGLTFGQWISALSRIYAQTRDEALRQRVLRLTTLLAESISTPYFALNRFPTYCYDKLVCGLLDASRLAGDPNASTILAKVTDLALPELPTHAIDRETPWRKPDPLSGLARSDPSWTWDESYTLPENLYLASAQIQSSNSGRYKSLAAQYLDDATYFDPLARGEDALAGKQAYSYVNALCSAMQAWFVSGSEKHLTAARNGFDLLERQSFPTGGWGPDEQLRPQPGDALFTSLSTSHNSFETPCGSYAHAKLTRYLLRATRSGRYGDSMERVLLNCALGALPLQPDGRAFYSADFSDTARRIYSVHRWPCCSGTLPQLAADHGINAYFLEPSRTHSTPDAIWINLYLASTLRFRSAGAHLELTQTGTYPADGHIRLRVTASHPVPLALHLRLPAWAGTARLQVNGHAIPTLSTDGFARVARTWRSGDVLTLDLPMPLRLVPLDERHPNVAALVHGPRVLFPIGPGPVTCTRAQALAARPLSSDSDSWQLETTSGPVRLAPFPALGDQPYSTCLRLT